MCTCGVYAWEGVFEMGLRTNKGLVLLLRASIRRGWKKTWGYLIGNRVLKNAKRLNKFHNIRATLATTSFRIKDHINLLKNCGTRTSIRYIRNTWENTYFHSTKMRIGRQISYLVIGSCSSTCKFCVMWLYIKSNEVIYIWLQFCVFPIIM